MKILEIAGYFENQNIKLTFKNVTCSKQLKDGKIFYTLHFETKDGKIESVTIPDGYKDFLEYFGSCYEPLSGTFTNPPYCENGFLYWATELAKTPQYVAFYVFDSEGSIVYDLTLYKGELNKFFTRLMQAQMEA